MTTFTIKCGTNYFDYAIVAAHGPKGILDVEISQSQARILVNGNPIWRLRDKRSLLRWQVVKMSRRLFAFINRLHNVIWPP